MTDISNETVEIIIPEDKINNTKYLYTRLLETSADILFKTSKSSDRTFTELLQKYLPEILVGDTYSEFLESYTKVSDNKTDTKETPSIQNTEINLNKTQNLSDIKKKPSKKIRVNIKKKGASNSKKKLKLSIKKKVM